jgi:hypothetical protein
VLDGVALVEGVAVLGGGAAVDGEGVAVVGAVVVCVVVVVWSVVVLAVVAVDVLVVVVCVADLLCRLPPKIVVASPEPRPIDWPAISSGTVKNRTQMTKPRRPVMTASRQRRRFERVE